MAFYRQAAQPTDPPPASRPTEQTTVARQPPTAPGRIPLVGHVPQLMRRPVPMLQALRAAGPVVKVYVGLRPMYIINAPHLIHRILVTETNTVARGRVFAKLRQYAGDSIATAEGEEHFRQRRLMMPAFHRDRFHTYVDIMRAQTAALCEKWRPGQEVQVEEAMAELASNIVSRSVCRAGVGEVAAAEIRRYMPILEEGMMWRTLSPTDLLEKLPTRGNRRFARARARLRQVIGEAVDAYLADPADYGDLLSMLASARDEDTGQAMSRDELVDQLTTLLIAGTRTTATVLTWLLHELSRNTEVEARLHHEVDSVLAGRPLAYTDLADLGYTLRLVKEALRLHSPVWMSMRRTVAPLNLDGVHIPAGADLVYSPVTIHRDPDLYPDPMRFQPDRWLPERAASLPRHAFIPFGNGRHKCLGDHFVLTEATVVLATVGARWRLAPAPGHEVREVAEITLHPGRVPMTVHPR